MVYHSFSEQEWVFSLVACVTLSKQYMWMDTFLLQDVVFLTCLKAWAILIDPDNMQPRSMSCRICLQNLSHSHALLPISTAGTLVYDQIASQLELSKSLLNGPLLHACPLPHFYPLSIDTAWGQTRFKTQDFQKLILKTLLWERAVEYILLKFSTVP